MGGQLSKPHRIIFKLIVNKDEAKDLLIKAEHKDGYLQECLDSTVNSKARHNMTYTPNLIGLQSIKPIEEYLEQVELPELLSSSLDTINIIQLMPSADGGMPHTRPESIICFPNISQLFSQSTLIHELWHVHQRKYKDYWLKVFSRIGWQLWNGILPEKLEDNRRYNPDTIDSPLWIFADTWVPVPVFRDITHPKVNDVDIWFYNVHGGYHSKAIPSEFIEYFSNLPAPAFEHPNETTAYMLADYEQYKNSRAFRDLIDIMGMNAVLNK
jgi:hypothetical protein